MTSYPRTLVISTTRFSTVTATGSALRNLFGAWPVDALAQIHVEGGDVDTELCDRYFRFEDEITSSLTDFAREFAPDVIYYRTIDEPTAFRQVAAAVSEATGAAIVTHTMDDWLGRLTATAGSASERSDAAAAANQLRDLINGSAANLAISEKMAEAMSAEYNRPFETFHNAIDFSEWEGIERTRDQSSDGVFRIRYTGSLAADMSLDSARDFAYVVDMLRREGRSIELEFSSAPWWQQVYTDEIAGWQGNRHAGFLDRRDYLQFLVDADLAIIPINFDDASLRYVGYSMSNKAPEYMAAQIPVLVYGPRESATIDYAVNAGWAMGVTERSCNELARAIRALMDDQSARDTLASRALEVGTASHDAAVNRERLRMTLLRAAEQSN